MRQSDPSGKTPRLSKTPSIPRPKNIPLYRNSESQYQSAIPVQGEGRSSVVTNVDRGVVDAAASGTKTGPGRDEPREHVTTRIDGRRPCLQCLLPKQDHVLRSLRRSRMPAYGETVWSWPSLLRSSLAEMVRGSTGSWSIVNSQGDGDKKELVAGESAA